MLKDLEHITGQYLLSNSTGLPRTPSGISCTLMAFAPVNSLSPPEMGLNDDVRDVAKLKLLLASCFVTYLLSLTSRIVVDVTPLDVYLLLVTPALRFAKENLLNFVLRSVSLSANRGVVVVGDVVDSCFSVRLFKDSKELFDRTPFVLFKTSQLSRRAPVLEVTLMLEA